MRPNGTNGYQEPDNRKTKTKWVCTGCNPNDIYSSHYGICNRCGHKGISYESWLINKKVKAGLERPKLSKPILALTGS